LTRFLQSNKNQCIEEVKLREPLFVKPGVGLLEMLGIFQEGQCHMAMVTEDPKLAAEHLRAFQAPPPSAALLGIVTLEDVLEKVIQGEIVDETDYFGSAKGGVSVTTTTLLRKISRPNFLADVVLDDAIPSGERRRSRSRASSRANLTSIFNTRDSLAGDVRHKSRHRDDEYGGGNGGSCSPARAVMLDDLDSLLGTGPSSSSDPSNCATASASASAAHRQHRTLSISSRGTSIGAPDEVEREREDDNESSRLLGGDRKSGLRYS
jgi:hypothetical protein